MMPAGILRKVVSMLRTQKALIVVIVGMIMACTSDEPTTSNTGGSWNVTQSGGVTATGAMLATGGILGTGGIGANLQLIVLDTGVHAL